MVVYNIIIVCDVCLDELVIRRYPLTLNKEEDKGWFIPPLINEGGVKTPASSMIALCPKHRKEV